MNGQPNEYVAMKKRRQGEIASVLSTLEAVQCYWEKLDKEPNRHPGTKLRLLKAYVNILHEQYANEALAVDLEVMKASGSGA